ncbi:hypothetical protein BDW75DRAFT_203018 [Aspergillus navahoensis]
MKFYYQILTTPTADTPGSALLLHFPGKRYLFGQIAEGFQRACTERGTKLTDVSDVFLSGRMGWETTGGLIGMILTKADARASSKEALEALEREKEANRQKRGWTKKDTKQTPANAELEDPQHDLTVHGSKNLAHTLATARRFVFRQGLPVHTKEYDAESAAKRLHTYQSDPFEVPTFSDENIKVWAMPISPSSTTPRSQSPKKRSLDEFREDVQGLVEVDQQSKDQLVRQSVVSHMFDSTWTLDALEETRLADVKMPAQIFVRNPETKDLDKYTGPLPGGDEEVPEMTVLVRKPWPGASISKIPTTTPCDESLCYIIKNHDLRGKFDAKKAIALNVKPGPDFGALTRGETVKATDGRTVTPDMVLEPTKPGKGLAVMDLPTPEYVESLLNRPEWKSPSIASNLAAFFWILGPGVGDHPGLHEFVTSMPDCKHIVSSTDYCPNYIAMQSVAGSAIRMARIRPDNYLVPIHDNNSVPQTQSSLEDRIAVDSHKHGFERAEPGLIVSMEPEFRINSDEVPRRLNAGSILTKMPQSAIRRARLVTKRLQHPLRQEKIQQFMSDIPGADAEIITLGTGSSAPSKYRNVSSTLVHVPGRGYYLLDCGEGTLGQLKRMFNPEQLRGVLQNLRLIWISHLHADHHLGTVSVIKAWYQENYPGGVSQSAGEPEKDMGKILDEKRLFIVSDLMMIEWLEEYAGVEDFGFAKLIPLSAYLYRTGDEGMKWSFKYRHCRADGSYRGREVEHIKPEQSELKFNCKGSPGEELSAKLRKATGLSDILTAYVSHCRGAMAVSLVFPDGFKVSFSGDCRPSPTFVTIGQDSTVLIHEATFSDDMVGSALAKKHSTAQEAIEVGRKMRARTILLTHFSQRYQKIAHFDQPKELVQDKSVTARDFRAHKSIRRKQATAAAEAASTDIPFENDIDAQEDLATDGPVALDLDASESLELSEPSELPEPDVPPRPIVPIIAAFDHMRVRIRDMYTLEQYAPAVERLFDIIERASKIEQNQAREQRRREVEENEKRKELKRESKFKIKKDQMDKEQRETAKAEKGARVSGRSPSRSRPQSPEAKVSIWDAPESESGWSSDDSGKDA